MENLNDEMLYEKLFDSCVRNSESGSKWNHPFISGFIYISGGYLRGRFDANLILFFKKLKAWFLKVSLLQNLIDYAFCAALLFFISVVLMRKKFMLEANLLVARLAKKLIDKCD